MRSIKGFFFPIVVVVVVDVIRGGNAAAAADDVGDDDVADEINCCWRGLPDYKELYSSSRDDSSFFFSAKSGGGMTTRSDKKRDQEAVVERNSCVRPSAIFGRGSFCMNEVGATRVAPCASHVSDDTSLGKRSWLSQIWTTSIELIPLSVSGTTPTTNKESCCDGGGTWVDMDEDKCIQVSNRRSLSYQESCSIGQRLDALESIVMPPQDQEDARRLVRPARRSQRLT